MLIPKTNSQTYWQKEVSHVMNGTIFFICLTSVIPAKFAPLRISAWPPARKRWRKGCKNRKEKRGLWQSQSRQNESVGELSCRAATKACDLIHGICLGHTETFLVIHVQESIHHRHLIKEFFTLGIKVLQVGTLCERVQGDLSRKVKNNSEAQFHCRVLQEDHQPWILSFH